MLDHQFFEHELPPFSFHHRAKRRVLGPLCEHKAGSLTKPPRLQLLLLLSTLMHSSNQVHDSFPEVCGMRIEIFTTAPKRRRRGYTYP